MEGGRLWSSSVIKLLLVFATAGTICMAHSTGLISLMMMPDWQTTGDAEISIIECDSCFTLTSATAGQTGCVWDQFPRDISDGIDLAFTMNFGNNNSTGADGMTLVISTIPDQCAGTGSSIGTLNFVEAFIIEFDTWRNPEIGDPNCDHVAIFLNQDQDYPLFGPECSGSFPLFTDFEDGEFHDITFTYDNLTGDIVVTFDGETLIDENFDIEGFLGGTEYYLGFTGSTGGSVNEHIVCPGIPVAPPEVPVIDQADIEVCAGDRGVIYSVLPLGEDLEWSAPPGASITTIDATSISVDFGDTGGDVCVWSTACVNSDTVCVAVVVLPLPELVVDIVPVICAAEYDLDELVLTGGDGSEIITYHTTESDARDGNNALTDLTITSDGLIYIRVESSLGCVQVLSVALEFGTLDVTYTPDPVPLLCVGSNYDLSTLNYTDLNGNVIITINYFSSEVDALTEQNAISPIIDEPGTYYARVESTDGCIDIVEIVITSTPLPQLEISPDTIGCNTPSIEITHTGSEFWIYTWSRPGGAIFSMEQFPTVTDTGTYFVEFMDGNGCSDTASVFIAAASDLPLTTVMADTLTCSNPVGRFNLDTVLAGYMYLWSGPNAYNRPVAEPTYDTVGTYTLIITAPSGCSAEITIEVLGNLGIPRSSYDIIDSITCAMTVVQPIVDTVFADASYTWTGPDDYVDSIARPEFPRSGNYSVTITANNGCTWDTLVTVLADTISPSAMLEADILTCLQDSTTIRLTTDGVDFSWMGPSDYTSVETSPRIGEAGTYRVTITASNGCTTIDSIMVEAQRDDPEILSITYDTLTCLVTETLLDVSPQSNDYEISWSQNGTIISMEEDLIVTDSGSYTLTVMALNGCTITQNVLVIKDESEPVFTLMTDTITCNTESANLQVSPPGVYDVAWQGPGGFDETGDEVTTMTGGAYTLLVTNRENGCTLERFFTVVADTMRATVEINNPSVFSCDTDSLQLLADTTRAISSIQWMGPSGYTSDVLNPYIYRPGEYTVTVTGVNGCTSADTVIVDQDAELPVVTLSADTITCLITFADVSAAGAEADWLLQWTLPDGSTDTGIDIVTTQSGLHTIVVTDPSTDCQFIDRIAVVLDTLSPSPIIAVSGSLSCTETQVNLSVLESITDGDEIVWTGPDGFSAVGAQVSVMAIGLYTVTVTSLDNGCSSAVSYLVERSGSGITDADLSTIPADCLTGLGSVRITAVTGGTAPYSYQLMSAISAEGLFTDLEAADYEMVIIDAAGCSYRESFTIDPSEQIMVDGITRLALDAGESQILEYTTTAPATTVAWTPPLAGCDSCLMIPVTSADAGMYRLLVSSSLGCTDLLDLTITVNEPDIFIPNVFSPVNQDGVNDIFSVLAGDLTGSYSMSIYDRWGSMVYHIDQAELNDPTTGWNGLIKGQLAMSGVYVYVARIDIDGSPPRILSGDVTLIY